MTLVVVLAAATVLGQPPTPAAADGKVWEAIAVPEGAWQSVAYGDGVWIAVAPTDTHQLMRSTDDGVTWSADGITGLATGHQWQSVAFGEDKDGKGLWVAVGNVTSIDAGGVNRVSVATSADGLAWETLDSRVAQSGSWRSVAYGDGVWVASRRDSIADVLRSTDGGRNWSRAVTVNDWRGSSQFVAYGDGVWIRVSNGGLSIYNKVIRSTDGFLSGGNSAAVDKGPPPNDGGVPDNGAWSGVAYGDGVWVAVNTDRTNRVMRSEDTGVTWTQRGTGNGVALNSWQSVAYGNGVWIAVSSTGTSRVMRSEDKGVTWTSHGTEDGVSANSWQSVAYGNGVWIAVSSDGTNRVMRSGAPLPVLQPQSTLVPPSVSCMPEAPVVGGIVTCTVTGGDAGIDILWRAAYNPVIAEAGVTLDASGSGEFSFVVPAAALGQELTVELVEWTAPVSLGVVGGPVPSSVPSGEGPVPVWTLGLAALAGIGLLRRGMRVEA